MKRSAWTLLLLVGLAAAPRPAPAQARLPNGFALQSVVLGPFDSPPVGFAFLPDGRLLVIEKDTGQVHLAPVGSTASVVVATLPNLTTEQERGLLGVAVDPSWPARPYVYFHSTRAGAAIHITMYTAAGDLGDPSSTNLTLGSPYTLLDDISDLWSTHNGGTLRFGPDGFLYASIGDDSRSCEAQILGSPLGKILRLDVAGMPGPGSGPPAKADLVAAGNPFAGGDWQRLVYAYGLRNPFRFGIDAASGDLYVGDVGLDVWEEIDALVQAGYTGANFGWPEFEGPLQDPEWHSVDCSLPPPYVDPIHVYPNPPTGVAAVTGGPRYRTDALAPYGFPRAYDGEVFLADFYGRWIRRLTPAGGGAWVVADSVAGQPSALRWADGFGQIADLQQGPDGGLYFAQFSSGALPRGVHRIVNTLPSDIAAAGGRAWIRATPNPASTRGGVVLHYRPAGSEPAHLRIHDVAGRLVRSLGVASAGGGVRIWDGCDRRGRRVAPGVYFVALATPSGPTVRSKLVLGR